MKHTLWLSKLALLDTGSQCAVEKRVEHLVVGVDGVVVLDILLEGWTAVQGSAEGFWCNVEHAQKQKFLQMFQG